MMYNFITDNGPDYTCSRCEKDIIGEIGHNCEEEEEEDEQRTRSNNTEF